MTVVYLPHCERVLLLNCLSKYFCILLLSTDCLTCIYALFKGTSPLTPQFCSVFLLSARPIFILPN